MQTLGGGRESIGNGVPDTHVKDLDYIPGSWSHPGIWGVKQWMGPFLLLFLPFKYTTTKSFNPDYSVHYLSGYKSAT